MDIDSIDFNDACQVNGAGHLLLSMFQRSGGLSYGQPAGGDMRWLMSAGKKWIQKVENGINSIGEEKVLTAISYYDILHRVCYRSVNSDFLRTQFARAFSARVNGNYDIDEIELYRNIMVGIGRRDRFYFDKPFQWLSLTQNRWLEECNKSTATVASANAFARTSLLLSSDLYAYFGSKQAEFKSAIAGTAVDMAALYDGDDATVWREIFMLSKNVGNTPHFMKKIKELKKTSLRRLSTSKQLNEYDRAAFALDLDFYEHECLA